jgi:cobalt-zinc-cadmium efflux system outer membrane protein
MTAVKPSRSLMTAAGVAAVVLIGCTGFPATGELDAQQDLSAVGGRFQQGMALPAPRADSGLDDFLRHAILNQPQVVAAYYDWAASVRTITVERSLPDPSLTLSADVTRTVETLMPGLMMDLPGPGKSQAAAGVATAESQAKYFTFETKVLEAAFALKKAYYELHFLDGKIRVNQETLRLANDTEQLATAQNEAGKVTLQDVLRAQMEQDRLLSEIENLEDARNPLIAQFKAALGLKRADPTPPVPRRFESTPLNLASDDLITAALARNPRLQAMEAEVQGADAALRLAYKAGVPDFSLGIEADVKATPTMVTPALSMTLPIWRDKIAAQIAAAQDAKAASEARVSAEEIGLAVEFSEKAFMVREAGRSLRLLQDRLLPKARQSVEVAQTSYASGKEGFLNLLEAQRTLRELQLSEVDALLQRELALAELSTVVLAKQPRGSPVLAATARTTPSP